MVRRLCALAAIGIGIGNLNGQTLDALISPGDLSGAHAHLSGLANCEKCHTPGQGVSEEKCLGCHEELATRIQARQGFHRLKDANCAACHAEPRWKGAFASSLGQGSFRTRSDGL